MTQDNFITKSPDQHGKLEKLESGVHGTTYSQFDRFIRLPSYRQFDWSQSLLGSYSGLSFL